MIGLGTLWKIIPVASGFFFAVGHPDLSREISDTITPIGYQLKDAILGFITYLGVLI
jgi:hypothetical protein